jgi:hypothetical protein
VPDFKKIFRYQISQKSNQWKLGCSMQMGKQAGRLDTMKLRVAFHNFANALKRDGKSYMQQHTYVSYFQYMHKNGMQKCFPLFHSKSTAGHVK